ncbi:helix-turn-helix domain-containing protein [Actinoplanes sp. HUAS TT8]|uniref:helix-turn-helix domain-containing protein n=1 Tax=Actinoplanes sp. HUAS TT8 TaxID=3447453 RepID=UPI003F51DE78
MALIYAFRDEAGNWHGDPGGPFPPASTCVSGPVFAEATLTFPSSPPGPFAGQALVVRSAGIVEATPGSIRYFLDDGTSCYATREVEKLLFGPGVTAARRHERWPPPEPAATRPAGLSSYWEITDGDRHYDLTATPGPDGTTVDILGADRDGQVIAHLQGTLPAADLLLVARLLRVPTAESNPRDRHHDGSSRSRGNDGSARGPRHGSGRGRRPGRWTAQQKALAVRRHHEGATIEAIAAEVGRSPTSVQYKLHYLGLVPLPFHAGRRRVA